MAIQFTKMSGSGNDFIIIDNRVPVMDNSKKVDFVKRVCDRKMSVGADGVIFVENSDKADIKWDFYNDDGSSAEMCGNGGRCVARYAVEKGITSDALTLETVAGVIAAKVSGASVRVKLTAPENLKQDIVAELNGAQYTIDSLNTGVPHAIIYSDNVENVNVKEVGNGIRFHDVFAPSGTNVEDETLACGTGTVASALLSSYKNLVKPPVKVETRGGEILKVDFDPANGSDVYLEGLTRISFEGTLGEY